MTVVSIPKAATQKLQQERTQAFNMVREGVAMQARGALLAGQGLIAAAPTFNVATETKEYQAWCVEASQKSWGTCQSYIAIAKAHASMTKKQQDKVARFTFEGQQAFATVPQDDRAKVLAKVGTNPTPELVREVRDEVKLAKLTPEQQKEQKQQKETREREQAAERTEKLAADLKKSVRADIRKGDVVEAMVHAALLVSNGRKPDDVADAIRRIANDWKAEQRAAERKQAAEKEAGEKLNELKEALVS